MARARLRFGIFGEKRPLDALSRREYRQPIHRSPEGGRTASMPRSRREKKKIRKAHRLQSNSGVRLLRKTRVYGL